ncbi:MAG TPA: HTTM domain-containing protein, partial [Myxococcota bacterium]
MVAAAVRLDATAAKPTTTTMVDAASVAVFRAAFGLLMFVATLRFMARGWVDEILAAPSFHFTFSGFSWVRPLPQPWLDVQYVVMATAALCIGLGVRVRLAAGVFFVLFTWAELVEKAAYLNHYYFVSLVALLLTIVRTDQWCAL